MRADAASRGAKSGGMPLELVIFDCDGVLVDSEPVVNRVEAAMFRTLGFPLNAAEMRRLMQGRTVGQVAAAVEMAIGRPIAAEELYSWGMTTALALVEELEPVAGVAEVIAHVAERGIPACVASQSPLPRVRLSLAVTKLRTSFGPNVFTASMVARAKPAPDLYLFAAERMGAAPHRCVVIEDSPSGVVAAREAGMTVFGYAADADAKALKDEGAHVFRAMSELPALLDAVR
jgi:HAD superfamily hydrolase (TIGR01509 family)